MPAKPAMPHIMFYYVASGRRVAEAASILGLKFGVLSVRLFSGWFLRLSVRSVPVLRRILSRSFWNESSRH